jgi:hypothetical protein
LHGRAPPHVVRNALAVHPEGKLPRPECLTSDHLPQHAVASADPVAALCVHIEGATRIVSRARKCPILRVFDKRLGEWAPNIRRLTILMWQFVKHEALM